ncbi:MAG: aldo/keto reductase [Oscillospiraceae bacterium]|nr:aldo/keto reductase [Oscillospiraceae bacterium]
MMPFSDLPIKDAEGKPNETLRVSRLCFGSLCMGPLQSDLSAEEGAKVICRAFELGVNFIDTAQLYQTYPHIRAALLACGDKNKKDKIIISTKTYAHTKKLAEEALNEALGELGREYIDIFLLHEQESIHTLFGHIEALEYLFEQKKAGKIKAVGISTHHVAGVRGALEFNQTYKKDRLDIIHPMYNMTGLGIIPERGENPENAVLQMESALEEAKKSGFFVFGMKALGGGNLFALAERALGFAFGKSFMDSVAVGMKSLAEVEANVHFAKFGKFPDNYHESYLKCGEKKRLHIDFWCEGCQKCVLACPQNALSINPDGKAACDSGRCVLCGYCSAACEAFAIKII